jgi:hypothetical protein
LPIIGGQERQERHDFGARPGSIRRSLPVIGGQGRNKKDTFLEQRPARLGDPCRLLADRRDRKDTFLEQRPARLGDPCQSLADRRDSKDSFSEQRPARSRKSLPIIGGQERPTFWSHISAGPSFENRVSPVSPVFYDCGRLFDLTSLPDPPSKTCLCCLSRPPIIGATLWSEARLG